MRRVQDITKFDYFESLSFQKVEVLRGQAKAQSWRFLITQFLRRKIY